MQVGLHLRCIGLLLNDDLGRPGRSSNSICSEERRTQVQFDEERCEPRNLADVFQRRVVARREPRIFLCIDGDVPATIYVHPWELDPDQPRLDVGWLTRVRHYGGIKHTADRLRRLLAEFRFQPMCHTVATL